MRVRPGRRFPLGATPGPGGTNFAVASGVADGMLLCLFDDAGAETRIALPDYDAGVWHGFVEGVGAARPGPPAKVHPSEPTCDPASSNSSSAGNYSLAGGRPALAAPDRPAHDLRLDY